MTTSIVFADIFRLVVFLILFLILLFDFLSLISSQLDFLPVDFIPRIPGLFLDIEVPKSAPFCSHCPRCLHYSYPNSIMLAEKKVQIHNCYSINHDVGCIIKQFHQKANCIWKTRSSKLFSFCGHLTLNL